MEAWLTDTVLRQKVIVNTAKANDIEWDRNNGIFADVMLRDDESEEATDLEGVPEENRRVHSVCTVPRVLNRKTQHAHD